MIRSLHRILISVFLGSLLLPPIAVVSSGYSLGQQLSARAEWKIAIYFLLAAVSFWGFLTLAKRFAPRFRGKLSIKANSWIHFPAPSSQPRS